MTCKWKVSRAEKNLSLLHFVADKLLLSKKKAKQVIDSGYCKLNSRIELFSSIKVQKDDLVEIKSEWEKIFKKNSFSIQTLYEDEYFLAIDKPVSLIVNPKELHRFFPKNYCWIHRLDKGTSGVILIAKQQKAFEKMVDLFREQKIEKHYLAVLDKELKTHAGEIHSFLRPYKKQKGQTLWKAFSKPPGREAVTYFTVKKVTKQYSVVDFQPITGRTHQLRVQSLSLGHPILGDVLYAKTQFCQKSVNRLMLHASSLSWYHPFLNKKIVIKAPMPQEFFPFLKSDDKS